MYSLCYDIAAWIGILAICLTIAGNLVLAVGFARHKNWGAVAVSLILGVLLSPLCVIIGVIMGFTQQIIATFRRPPTREELEATLNQAAKDAAVRIHELLGRMQPPVPAASEVKDPVL